jgi:lysozyme family protein
VTLMSYDGRCKVVRAMAEKISFDERLQVAKSMIDECIHKWAKGANRNLQVLVNQAFQTDKEGNVSAGRILALRRYKIEDEQWAKAMDAIADSMRVASSKAYVRCYQRNDLTGEYQPITLDVAGV